MAMKRRWWKTGARPNIRYQHARGDVVCADALAFLHQLREGIADIVFLDPPFNLGKRYSTSTAKRADRLPEEDYMHYMRQMLLRACDLLAPGGALYLYHIPRIASQMAPVLNDRLQFRHWIAVSMKNGFVRGEHLYPAHYALLYYTKGSPAAFDRPRVAVQNCRHCKRPVRDYGGYARHMAQGVNLSDFWDDLAPVRHKKFKNRRANELPLTMLRRVVAISGQRNGVLVDPFVGAGTSVAAALEGRMRFVACDRESEACRDTRKRLKHAAERQ